jgi:hypothetical protein
MLTIPTWNVRSMLQPRKMAEIVDEAGKFKTFERFKKLDGLDKGE